jgi:hypothetical protein
MHILRNSLLKKKGKEKNNYLIPVDIEVDLEEVSNKQVPDIYLLKISKIFT